MRLRFWIGLTAVVALAASSVVVAVVVYVDGQSDLDRRESGFAIHAADHAESAVELSIGRMVSATSVFQARGPIGRRDFELLGRSLLREGVLSGAGFLPRVTDAERAAYERRHGFPITERAPDGRLRKATQRPVYYPVTYVEADVNPSAVLGYDFASDPSRYPDLREAGETGRTIATPVTRLLLGAEGTTVYHPIYRGAEVPATEQARRRALTGFVAMSIQASDLAATTQASLPAEVESQLRADERIVAGQEAELEDPSSAPLDVADDTWVLVVRDPTRPDISLPLLLAVVGVSLAALLAALILTWSRNERMEQLRREASEDPLTGLKNRRRFEEELRAAMARGRRDGSTGAMLMLDIDHFKTVNDTFGHPAGDQLIREIAAVLRRRTRESDVLARLGGDEFAVVLPRCSLSEALVVAEAINTAIREHEPTQPGLDPVTASVGVAMFGEDHRVSAASVVSEADTAMYAAKDGGRDGVRVFDPAAVGEERL